MIDLAMLLSVFDKIVKGGRHLHQFYKRNPASYLNGTLTSGLEVAYRIIALFEAHNVKRTQIYQLLGQQFQEVTPAIEAEDHKSYLSGELIKKVSALFNVRQAWIEGEDGQIYDPLIFYKSFGDFVQFVRKLEERNKEDHCFLFVYKSNKESDDLYADYPEIELVFAEPLGEVGEKTILRYFPVYGPLPWGHDTSRFHLSAFFNVTEEARGILVRGYSVPPREIGKIGSGEVIPSRLTTKNRWHPEDFGYPQSYTIGRLNAEDWAGFIQYFSDDKDFPALKTSFR